MSISTLWLFFFGSFLLCSPASIPNYVTDKELECFSQEKIYHKSTDKCYKLLTTGPCPRGHWFVLEKPKETLRGNLDTTIKGVCVREVCKEGEFYWGTTKSCVQGRDKTKLCIDPVGEEILTNVFGEGECTCGRDPPRVRLRGDHRMRCYPLYTRGPCPPAQVLGYLGKSDQATCISDACHAETKRRRRNRTLPKDAVLAPWENGTCYELGTRGPCPEGLTFKVHSLNNKPGCVSLTNSLFQLEKSRNCFEDEEGRCQKQIKFNKNQTAVNYRKELFKRFIGARRRRTAKGSNPREFSGVNNNWKWIHPKKEKPNCGSLFNHIFGDLKNCNMDENFICQKKAALKKRSIADKFMKELRTALSRK